MGMVGGGYGAFIGDVHRRAANLDGQIECVAGAFDIDPKKGKQFGVEELYLDPSRSYGSFSEMLKAEKALPEDKRIDFVTIVTPNFVHFPVAKAALEAGFHVMCEKPMTLDVKEAKALQKIVKKTGKVFALNHNYTGYPMVKLAKDMVKKGDLGKILKIIVQYPQAWLIRPIEKTGQQQASWRVDPKRSGAAGCMGDIGTHAENLAEYITGLRIVEICGDLTAFVAGRKLDDDGNCLIHFEKGAKGILHASQVSAGHENDLAIWVYGENGSLEWHQEHPNQLMVKPVDAPIQIWSRGNGYVGAKSALAAKGTRLPSGHPEAFFEAFANNYMGFVERIRACESKSKLAADAMDVPDVDDGVRGMQFIETVVKSSKAGAKWTKFPK
ncbi:MAG: Gfo/Idh/MocA family oxidoreductase [Planctomycetes bacterium]|nr:Gfo/Idh/MocA family oxidoreductase [Planctomycetota bacterium]